MAELLILTCDCHYGGFIMIDIGSIPATALGSGRAIIYWKTVDNTDWCTVNPSGNIRNNIVKSFFLAIIKQDYILCTLLKKWELQNQQ